MPPAGYFHFYMDYIGKIFPGTDQCQCPQRAIFISTKFKYLKNTQILFGVNALSGLFSFLLVANLQLSIKIMVSMPSAGYFHFYSNLSFYEKAIALRVSMPSAGYFHFYFYQFVGIGRYESLCQCPQRAIFISTILSKDISIVNSVSMPSAGYFHFYILEKIWKKL